MSLEFTKMKKKQYETMLDSKHKGKVLCFNDVYWNMSYQECEFSFYDICKKIIKTYLKKDISEIRLHADGSRPE